MLFIIADIKIGMRMRTDNRDDVVRGNNRISPVCEHPSLCCHTAPTLRRTKSGYKKKRKKSVKVKKRGGRKEQLKITGEYWGAMDKTRIRWQSAYT